MPVEAGPPGLLHHGFPLFCYLVVMMAVIILTLRGQE
jgi:hypothetical protein